VAAHPVDDAAIRAQIAKDFEQSGEIWCPHTATGFDAYDHLSEADRKGRFWSVCATAHPAKFESIVEPIVGRKIEVPDSLAAILKLPTHRISLEPNIEALRRELEAWH
jgi:threonine synthase